MELRKFDDNSCEDRKSEADSWYALRVVAYLAVAYIAIASLLISFGFKLG